MSALAKLGLRPPMSKVRSKSVSEALLTLLKWCLLGLVYLFFFRVLQVTWQGSTTNVAVRRVTSRRSERRSAKGPEKTQSPTVARALTILEPAGSAGQRFEVLAEMTIGRAAGCHITLDDTFLSQLHARVLPSEDGLVVEDLGSTNGTYLNGHRLTSPVALEPGDRLQLGGVVFEISASAVPAGKAS